MTFLRAETSNKIAGFSALGFIILVTAGAFLALASRASGQFYFSEILSDSYLHQVIWFTLWQAFVSTVLSVLPAIFVARALARQQAFFGRNTILKLFALPLALPALVGVLAILGLWGKAGWLNTITAEALNFSIFGLPGILIAHIFFNMPLATRLILNHLERIPAENWRLASQLDLPPTSIFQHLEWPVIKAALPGVLALVFMLCLTSFTIVLTLGGGPSSTTLEVAIYQSLRFDFDPGRAVILALIQLTITVLLLALSFKFTSTIARVAPLNLKIIRPDASAFFSRSLDSLLIIVATSFIALPLATLLVDGLASDLVRLVTSSNVWQAIITSTVLAFAAASLCLVLSWSMLKAIGKADGIYARSVSFAASAILVMPTIVLGSGWFVLLHRFGDVFSFAPLLVIVINSLMALPFVYRILAPAMAEAAQAHNRLAAMLAIAGWARWKLVDFPVLKKPLVLAFSFAMALSLGDLGVIALFGSEGLTTLPLLLFKSLGSYRTDDARGLALILSLMCFIVLYGAEKYAGGKNAYS
jgi:thiamine transport system permease protein